MCRVIRNTHVRPKKGESFSVQTKGEGEPSHEHEGSLYSVQSSGVTGVSEQNSALSIIPVSEVQKKAPSN